MTLSKLLEALLPVLFLLSKLFLVTGLELSDAFFVHVPQFVRRLGETALFQFKSALQFFDLPLQIRYLLAHLSLQEV